MSLQKIATDTVMSYLNNPNRLKDASLSDCVLSLLGNKWDFQSEADVMEQVCKNLLEIATNPEVSKLFTIEHTGERIVRMIDFFRSIANNKQAIAEIELVVIDVLDISDQRFKNIIKHYRDENKKTDFAHSTFHAPMYEDIKDLSS